MSSTVVSLLGSTLLASALGEVRILPLVSTGAIVLAGAWIGRGARQPPAALPRERSTGLLDRLTPPPEDLDDDE